MTARTDSSAAEWVSNAYPHLEVDLDDPFQVDAIAVLSSIDTGPHNVRGRPLRTIETTELIYGDFGSFGEGLPDDEIERRLLSAPACAWEVNAKRVSIVCTNEPGRPFMARVAKWPAYACIKGASHVAEIDEFEWSQPGFIGDPAFHFMFATTSGTAFAEHTYTEVALWRP